MNVWQVYVQTLLKQPENSSSLLQDIDAGAYVYVCGATAMGNDVHETIVDIVAKGKGIAHTAATDFVKTLQDKGRYVQELWSE
jgi:sulfite reductase alpha subunit-like flavoprotein